LNLLDFKAQDIKDNEIAVQTWWQGYALFGPDQFRLMVNGMVPERGVYFAGEHLSMYHSWIVGALNSASRAVSELLICEFDLDVEEVYNTLLKDGKEFTLESFANYTKYFS